MISMTRSTISTYRSLYRLRSDESRAVIEPSQIQREIQLKVSIGV